MLSFYTCHIFQCSETSLLQGQELCRELCVDDIASKITCHTFHLNKPAVFTLDSGNKKVVKAVIKMEDQKVPMEEVSGEEEEVSNILFSLINVFACVLDI